MTPNQTAQVIQLLTDILAQLKQLNAKKVK